VEEGRGNSGLLWPELDRIAAVDEKAAPDRAGNHVREQLSQGQSESQSELALRHRFTEGVPIRTDRGPVH
jgi:hypothetical protein